ncbi:MAG TPA: hypothetical protein VJL80_10050, partial [Aeromicrobium sp.]
MAAATDAAYVVDFPTLWVVPDWIEAHCVVPDRDRKGQPFVMYEWQLWCTVNHYRVKPDAKPGQLASAFHYRRSQVVAPQKTGKGPWAAAIISAEARGPVIFDGWAKGGELYECADHGCGCGWYYEYAAGEPMGRPWATPLIQLTATSDDQTANVYDPLKAMLRYGQFDDVTVGEEFSRLPNDGRIETVTSSALSRLGNPIIFALQDETGLYTDANKLRKVAETQRRGAAGMGGRSMETTNPPDPSEDSVAQRTMESKRPDIFRFWRNPDEEPSLRRTDGSKFRFTVARERRKILEFVYAGSLTTDVVRVEDDGTEVYGHVDLDTVEAEALELMEKDPGQAERFYGNRMIAGHGVWCVPERWNARKKPRTVKAKTQVVVGFDGSDTDDWTGFRCETREGYQFTPTFPDGRPMVWDPAKHDGKVPRAEVSAGLAHIMTSYSVVRVYADPPYWESECDAWAESYGEDVVIRWYTKRPTQMHAAAERLHVDLGKSDSTFWHDGCEITQKHVEAAHKTPRPSADQPGRYILRKPGDGR